MWVDEIFIIASFVGEKGKNTGETKVYTGRSGRSGICNLSANTRVWESVGVGSRTIAEE